MIDKITKYKLKVFALWYVLKHCLFRKRPTNSELLKHKCNMACLDTCLAAKLFHHIYLIFMFWKAWNDIMCIYVFVCTNAKHTNYTLFVHSSITVLSSIFFLIWISASQWSSNWHIDTISIGLWENTL